eukprot:TRINITY_DN8765_c0_g1_i1.p1 TRINITY_DN8765_c0_g1~~TRINITY_DN8765_c0_g1_i1.p1  ORF type:complete len:154 (-),score=28.58 TRINITY_DN8765_c0_g1_i1:76-537(-)
MLKLSTKRSYQEFLGNKDPSSCSPRKISFLDSTPERPTKRMRTEEPEIRTAEKVGSIFPLHHSNHNNISEEKCVELAPKQKRKKIKKSSEKLFSLDEVKIMVQKAVEERELQIREEYDNLLRERLQEQFNYFTKFNEDNINKSISQSTYNYMS